MDGNKMNGLLQRQNLRASQKPFAAMEMARMECRIPLQATVECVHASSLSPTLMSECASCFFFPSTHTLQQTVHLLYRPGHYDLIYA